MFRFFRLSQPLSRRRRQRKSPLMQVFCWCGIFGDVNINWARCCEAQGFCVAVAHDCFALYPLSCAHLWPHALFCYQKTKRNLCTKIGSKNPKMCAFLTTFTIIPPLYCTWICSYFILLIFECLFVCLRAGPHLLRQHGYKGFVLAHLHFSLALIMFVYLLLNYILQI